MDWERFDEDEVFEFLDDLRESGVVNMFGATPFLMDAFDMDKEEAGEWLLAWMRSFDQRHEEE